MCDIKKKNNQELDKEYGEGHTYGQLALQINSSLAPNEGTTQSPQIKVDLKPSP